MSKCYINRRGVPVIPLLFWLSPRTHIGVFPEKEIEPDRCYEYLEGDKVI